MRDTLADAADALRRAGDLLSDAGARLPTIDPGASAFGTDGPGRLAGLGRDLYLQWQRALDARAREAAAHGARLAETGDAVARAAAGYADTDEGASRNVASSDVASSDVAGRDVARGHHSEVR